MAEVWAPVDRITKLPPKATVDALEGAVVEPHVEAPEPHPAYDDIPSLTTLFENRLA